MTDKVRAAVPKVYKPLFKRGPRYKVFYGGRGAGRSWACARALLVRALGQKIRVLCTREIQRSLKDSVHTLLRDQIAALGLGDRYLVHHDKIVSITGSEFIFAGLRHNVEAIKSLEGVDICWVEEAERVSEYSWEVLIPTIRKPGSEIWVTFNPSSEDDPTYVRFVKNPPPDALVVKTTWRDNPFFPDTLKAEKDYMFRVDPDAAAHIWEGECRSLHEAQILAGKWIVDSFEPGDDWHGPYFGADWGFAKDPTVLVKCWIHENKLYIEREAYGVGVEITDTPALFDRIEDARKYVIRADSSRPETISHVANAGFRIIPAKKWPGSVEDGIAFLRSFEQIVIHQACKHAIEEARLYSYAVDRLTGDVLPKIVDKHNHIWDAVRYALEPMIKRQPAWGVA